MKLRKSDWRCRLKWVLKAAFIKWICVCLPVCGLHVCVYLYKCVSDCVHVCEQGGVCCQRGRWRQMDDLSRQQLQLTHNHTHKSSMLALS